ncbi:MAG: hypothetical protein ACAI35_24475 [Candidatus Methylacidiphilales bacterium]|nr:hypothetical protein [Candidatus Methylacidiphilales bacterium]
MKLTHQQMLTLPQAETFPLRDDPVYLGDWIIHCVQTGDRRGLSQGDIIEAGNGTLVLTEASYTFTPARPLSPDAGATQPAEPTLGELATRFTTAVSAWVTAGMPVVSETEYQTRAAACTTCPLWDPAARLGLGRCNHSGCGCTKLKRWLATEKCPAGKWPTYPADTAVPSHTSHDSRQTAAQP